MEHRIAQMLKDNKSHGTDLEVLILDFKRTLLAKRIEKIYSNLIMLIKYDNVTEFLKNIEEMIEEYDQNMQTLNK